MTGKMTGTISTAFWASGGLASGKLPLTLNTAGSAGNGSAACRSRKTICSRVTAYSEPTYYSEARTDEWPAAGGKNEGQRYGLPHFEWPTPHFTPSAAHSHFQC